MHRRLAAALLVLFLAYTAPALAQRTSARLQLAKSASALSGMEREANVNRVHLLLNSLGGLESSESPSSWVNGWTGGDWGSYDFIFDQGLWVTGKRNGLLGGLPYSWTSPYAPGPVINGQPALAVRPQDSLRYKVYSITRGETSDMNPDVAAWPADLGAPVDAQMKPRLLGDQTLWMTYNGVDPANRASWNYIRTPSPQIVLPLEIHQTVFAHFGDVTDTTVWANTVFFEWAIYNKGSDLLDSVYLTFWTDVDMLSTYADMPAIDTLAQTGYCWYKPDSTYGCTGYTLLYGPAVPSSAADTAVFFGTRRPGYRNLALSSFWPVKDDSYPNNLLFYGPPYTLTRAWNVVRGLMQTGDPVIDSVTRRPTKFPFSGDPLTHTGSVCPWDISFGGAGFMMTVGPVTIAPRDSQWIMMALMPEIKLNGVDAITRMRSHAAYLRSLPYDSLVTMKSRRQVPTNPLPAFDIPASFALGQNYPNPFNGSTTIPFDLPEKSRVRMEVFDVLGRPVARLANDVLERGARAISWFPAQASGVYFVRIDAASLESAQRWTGMKKLVLMK